MLAKWGEGAIWLSAATAALLAAPTAEAETWTMDRAHVLGASLRMTAHGADENTAAVAFAAAQAEISRLDAVLSGWRGDSELAALNNAAAHQASPDLFAVISQCERWREESLGAYCARQGRVESAWRQAAQAGAEPDAAQLAEWTSAIAVQDVALDSASRTITRPDGVRFAIDGLAKGYIIDAAIEAARNAAPALQGMMIEIGGDLRAWGAAPDAQGWRIGVADPAKPFDNVAPLMDVRLRDKAIATSGGGARDHVIAGRAVSHLISPFTGWALARPNRASVIADRVADADALATALAVLPPYEGMRLVARIPGADALVINADGETWMSPGWSAYTLADNATCQDAAPPPAVSTGPAWPNNFALSIRYDIPRIDAADYERPYVVIWISDAQRRLVRTLAVLGDRARFRESNYVWWRRFERLTPEAVQAVSRPTRAPGRYDLIWDGLDDQGHAVGQGRYTLNIEAAREHGGHSFQAIDLDLGDGPQRQQAAAQAEIGAVSASYGARR